MPAPQPNNHKHHRNAPPVTPPVTLPTAHRYGAPSFRKDHMPEPWELRQIRRLQTRLEAAFWDEDPSNAWVGTEVLLGSEACEKLLSWYLRRKPFFQRGAIDDYCRLLTHHMKGMTITAHVRIDPEDGWLCLWFTVYGLPRLRRPFAIHREHQAFLDALFDEGTYLRNTSEHVDLQIAETAYRPRR